MCGHVSAQAWDLLWSDHGLRGSLTAAGISSTPKGVERVIPEVWLASPQIVASARSDETLGMNRYSPPRVLTNGGRLGTKRGGRPSMIGREGRTHAIGSVSWPEAKGSPSLHHWDWTISNCRRCWLQRDEDQPAFRAGAPRCSRRSHARAGGGP